LLAALVIAGLIWVLGDERDSREPDTRNVGGTTHCAACGGVINADWRLCPHCGERLTTFGAPTSRR